MKHFSKKRSIAALALATALLLTACGGGNNNAVDEGALSENDALIAEAVKKQQLPFVPEGKEISLELGVGASANVTDYETNKFSLWLEEKTGLDLNFKVYQALGDNLKVSFAADDESIPDLIMNWQADDGFLVQYGVEGEGVFVDLGPYMDEYGVNLKKAIDYAKNYKVEQRRMDIEKWLLSSDGHRYFMPYIVQQEGNVYSGKAYINKVWLDKLGLKMPTTTEELKTVLTAFVNDDPNGNGKKDEIGITGAKGHYRGTPWMYLMNSFIFEDQSKHYVVDQKTGKLSLAYTQPEFKEGLKYINSLVKEGLYDVESFSQDSTALKTICNLENNIVGLITTGSPDALFTSKPERMLDYVALPNPTGPKGVNWAFRQARDARVNGTMTKYCEDRLAGFALMDFMLSEEASIFARYGEEGPDWRQATDADIPMFANIGLDAKIVPILGYGVPQNAHWQAGNPQFRFPEIADGMAIDAAKANEVNGEKVKADAITAYYGKAPEKIVEKQLFTFDENTEFSELHAQISACTTPTIAAFITGEKDIDKEWDAFQKELKDLGVDRYLELSQIGYDRFEKGAN